MLKFLSAKFTLALSLLKNILLWPLGRHGHKPWLAAIAAEQLRPVSRQAWESYAGAGACIGCGLCQSLLPAHAHAAQPAPLEIQSALRNPADAVFLASSLAPVLAKETRAFRALCPGGVDPKALRALQEAHRGSIAS